MKKYENNLMVDWILITKGIGIILVVIGHFTPEYYPNYWMELKRIIYLFHMPLFFIISGYLYNNKKQPYLKLVDKKIKRLLFPFISVALLFFLIKYSVSFIIVLQHPVTIKSILSIVVDPVHSYMPLLWFVYALFLIFILYPFFKYIFKYDLLIILFFIGLNISIRDDCLILGDMIKHVPFFSVGILLRDGALQSKVKYYGVQGFILLFFLFSCLAFIVLNNKNYLGEYMAGILGALCVFSVSNIVTIYSHKKIKYVIRMIGCYSMSIYLFHTLFQSSVRILFSKLEYFYTFNFLLIAFIAICAGVIFPLLMEKYILRKNRYSKKYILGIPD